MESKSIYFASLKIYPWIILGLLYSFTQHNFMYKKKNKLSQLAPILDKISVHVSEAV